VHAAGSGVARRALHHHPPLAVAGYIGRNYITPARLPRSWDPQRSRRPEPIERPGRPPQTPASETARLAPAQTTTALNSTAFSVSVTCTRRNARPTPRPTPAATALTALDRRRDQTTQTASRIRIRQQAAFEPLPRQLAAGQTKATRCAWHTA